MAEEQKTATEDQDFTPPGLANRINENDFFTFDKEQNLIDEEEDLKDFDGFNYSPDAPADEDSEEEDEDLFEEGEEEDDSEESLFGDDAQAETEDEDFTDADLAMFNKKLNKDFADVEELKKFLNEGDKKDAEKVNVNELEQAENVMNYLTPLLDRNTTSDEDLLRREFETIAINNKQDITDEDVQFDIDEKIEKLRDTNQIDLRANSLRADLMKVYNEHKGKKDKIQAQTAAQEAAQRQTETEAVQNAFAEIARRESFFGITPEKSKIREAYKKVNSGEFLKKLQSDKNALAKFAVIEAYENEIHKKSSSGLTYSDGIRAVRDEFKGVKEKNSGSTIVNAQKRGSAGSGSGQAGLISSLTR